MYTSIVVCALLAFYFLTQSLGLEIKIKTSIYAFCIFAAISVDLYEYQKDQNSEKLKIDLNLRPQNLEPEMYFKLVREYENLRC